MSNNVHVNPNFRPGAPPAPPQSSSSSSSVHINPKFKRGPSSSSKVHVNPNFVPTAPSAAPDETAAASNGPSPHINPNFNRPLPAVPGGAPPNKAPHVNPAFIKKVVAIDAAKQKEYDAAVVKKAAAAIAQAKVFVNPKFGNSKTTYVDPSRKTVAGAKKRAAADSPNSSSEKENSPGGGVTAGASLNRRTVFKKIGKRKLVRVEKKVQQPKKMVTATTEVVQPARSTPFRKIGTRKLIRLQSRNSAHKSPKTTPNHFVYKVKSSRITTPRHSPAAAAKRGFFMSRLVTPLSLRKKRSFAKASSPSPRLSKSHNAHLFHKVLNPFKVDRRPKAQVTESKKGDLKQGTSTPPLATRTETPRQPVRALQTPKSVPPPKPARKHTPATQPKQGCN